MQCEISFPLYTNLTGIHFTLITNLILLGEKLQLNVLPRLNWLPKNPPRKPLSLLWLALRKSHLRSQPNLKRKSMSSPNTLRINKWKLQILETASRMLKHLNRASAHQTLSKSRTCFCLLEQRRLIK